MENAAKSLISFEGNREPSSYIFDIDGVIFKHDKGSFSETGEFHENPVRVKENIDFINHLYNSGSYIVLFSSRPESVFSKTTSDLKKAKVSYHKLILGATSGTRYLVNDIKPSNQSVNTAVAINTQRDKPIEDTPFDKIDFIKDCTKGSGASTTIFKNQTLEKIIVRKWTSSHYQDVSKTLYRQSSYLKLMQKYIRNSVPEILNWEFSAEGISFYDMSFIEGTNLTLNQVKNKPILVDNLCNILCSLYESNSISYEKEDFQDLVCAIIERKLKPSISESINSLKSNLSASEFISYDLISKLNLELDKITKKLCLWKKHNQCLIHGDLTLENIFIKKDNIYLIDPLGSTMDIRANGSMQQLTTPIFDLGKLFQSIISQYESWAYLNEPSIETYIKNFSVEEEISNISESINLSKNLISFFEQYIEGNVINDGLFSLAQILIRVCPYRIRAGYDHSAFVCLLKSYSIIKYLNNF